MGASGIGGGKKNVNVELNLVPYIDLLSTLICFLLITAVWQQINAMSTNAQNNTSSENASPPSQDIKKIDLSISLFLDRVEMTEGTQIQKVFHTENNLDQNMVLKTLSDWKLKYPEKKDVTVHSDSQVAYKDLILIMDLLTETEFPDIGINTN